MFVTLRPAYGRDYKTAKAVKEDWNAGKDFIIDTLFHPYDGKMINKEDAAKTGDKYNVRFAGNRKTVNV